MASNLFSIFLKLKMSSISLLLPLLNIIVLVGATSTANDAKTIKIGAILDLNSRMGKEQKTAMQIAVENFDNMKISIDFKHNCQSLLQTALEAEALIKENKVEVIIVGIDNWQATALVAQIGTLAQVPIISLAASPPITSPFASLQWPFLVQMSHNATLEIQNIASIIHSNLWRRVIIGYEDDTSNNNCGSCGTISFLTQALQNIGSQVEYHLVLPSFSSTSNPRVSIKKEMTKFINEGYYSRVFIVMRVSLPYISLLFEEAKEMGLMRNDSVWIVSESVTNFLPFIDTTTMLSMEGALGIMTKFDKSTLNYETFEAKFGIRFLQEYEKERYNVPSFQALLAYDAITTIIKAKQSLVNTIDNNIATPKNYLKEILSTNFSGLSGHIFFDQEHNNLASNTRYALVNIASASYREVLDFSADEVEDKTTAKTLASEVNWPGNLTGGLSPKGWAMPTYTKPMRIGVPVAHTYKNFIDYKGIVQNESRNASYCISRQAPYINENHNFNGHCIRLFDEVRNILGYELPYVLIPHSGTYDELVYLVHKKCYDAAIGDMTILARRSKDVDFTLPFAESGFSIVVPAQESYDSHGPWIFLKPFTTKMWLVTFALFVYTMFITWAMEHGHNSDFRGHWKNQLSATIWFTINSLYFAQREKVSSKLTRVVVIIWLFIVLILTTSYTANLTSMITNERLNQTSIDIEMFQRTNAKVGYDELSFINKFLEDLLKFNPKNMIGIKGKFEDIHSNFQAGNISAACLEYLYAQLFVTQYCNKYIMTNPIYRFGGFGFVFPKGSPIAADVSEAILVLTENGMLKDLEKKYLNIRSECFRTPDDTDNNKDERQSSLSLKSFEFLFWILGAVSTICFLASFIPGLV